MALPLTQDTAANQLANDSIAPSYAGGYYGDQVDPTGGGYVSPEEQALIGNQVPGQAAITNGYDLAPSYSTTSEPAMSSAGNQVPGQAAITEPYTGAPNFGSPASPSNPVSTSPDSAAAITTPLPNPLNDYPSYTYGLSLHMLTVDEYNQVIRDQTFVPNRVIIASAGRYNNSTGANQFTRAPHFDVDFYFENLTITTVVAPGENNRATNAISFSFKIIEPYGVTLFNRILKLTKEINPQSTNYLEQPYLLQIDFFGSNDAGEIIGIIPSQTKRMPIRFLKFDIKVSNKGAEYEVQASPYGHSAYDQSTVSTPAHFEVVAGSVSTFFQSIEADSAMTDPAAQRTPPPAANGQVIGPDGQPTYMPLAMTTNTKYQNIASADPVYRVKSYGSAYNAWQNKLVKSNKIQFADKIFFKFDPEIGEAKFDMTGKFAAKTAPMAGVEDAKTARKSNITNNEVLSLDYNTQIYSVNAGTSIETLLNYVIRNSDYVQNQLVIPEDTGGDKNAYQQKKLANADKPLKWFKIVPTVKLDSTKFDKVRKVWAREITYNIIPYEIYNTKISVAPQGTWNNPTKVYNYIYTGLNTEVIDFQIEFNALYYTASTAYRDNLAGIQGLPVEETEKEDNADGYSGISADAVQPPRERLETQNARARATGGNESAKSVAAVDVEQSLYTMAGGDMLQAKLTINGDPQYIKQDDCFYTPDGVKALSGADPRLLAGGSLKMDGRPIYIQVNFRTPSDIDESTGTMQFDNNYNQSAFSGMYQVLTVDSVFSGGQFKQTLETVRMFRQKQPLSGNQSTTGQPSDRVVDDPTAVTYTPPTAGVDYPNYSTTSPAPSDVTAPGNNPVADTAAPVTTPDQAQLAATADTAAVQPINESTEPVAVAPNFAPISVRGNQIPGAAAII